VLHVQPPKVRREGREAVTPRDGAPSVADVRNTHNIRRDGRTLCDPRHTIRFVADSIRAGRVRSGVRIVSTGTVQMPRRRQRAAIDGETLAATNYGQSSFDPWIRCRRATNAPARRVAW
jgi:hypothetical protein